MLCAGAILALVFAALPGPASGDQRAPDLPALFTALADAPDPQTAYTIERTIWSRWLQGPDESADALLEAARDAASAGRLDEALNTLDGLTERYPDFAEAWNQRAIVHFVRRDLTRSLADIERTLALEPRHFGALAGRGQCHFHLEQYEDALTAFEAALQVHPWLPAARQQADLLRMIINAPPPETI